MAEQPFPQIPSTVWWGVRQLLQKSPRAKFDDSTVAAQLGVQPAAARQYITELRRVGVLDEDGRGTDLANRWRLDESYVEAVGQIARSVYPESLVTIAPPGSADRQKVVNWFMINGLGEGSARNKAATYLLITSSEPHVSPPSGSPRNAGRKNRAKQEGDARESTPSPAPGPKKAVRVKQSSSASSDAEFLPLNVNVQIHISADASSEQIETIFSAMKKYLRND